MKKHRTFIIGAGLSTGAGIGLHIVGKSDWFLSVFLFAGLLLQAYALFRPMFTFASSTVAAPLPSGEVGEVSVVHLRTTTKVPAKFLESCVYYDAWGSPYIHGDAYHDSWMTNQLEPGGRVRGGQLEWMLKSGPPVTFPDMKERQYGWFPKHMEK